MLNLCRPALPVLAAVLLGPAIASAATITFTNSIAPTVTDASQTLFLSQFNPVWGTLTSVTISLLGSNDVTQGLENLGPSAAAVNATTTSTLSALGTGISPLTTTSTLSHTYTLSAYDGTTDFGGTSGILASATLPLGSVTEVVPGSSFSNFVGSGTYSVSLAETGASSTIGGGNLATSFTDLAAAEVAIAYTYSVGAVPEASTWAMMLCGIAGIVCIRLRYSNTTLGR